MKLDLVLRLREARRLSGLSQKEAAAASGVGEKSISSYETGERINSLKVEQLRRLLQTYGTTEEEFYSDAFADRLLSCGLTVSTEVLNSVAAKLRELPDETSERLVAAFALMISTHQAKSQNKGDA